MKYHSKILNENFTINKQNTVIFENGIQYNSYDVVKLKKETIETRRIIHFIKKIFEI